MKKTKKKIKALALFSGGLDSILAVKLLQKQGLKITGLTFVSYFFDSQLAEKSAKQLGIELKIIDISEELLEIVKKPRFGYGKSINPCIDCHILMLKKTKEFFETGGHPFGYAKVPSPACQRLSAAMAGREDFCCGERFARPVRHSPTGEGGTRHRARSLFYAAKRMSPCFSFVFTGEVLGERPMSQNKQSLDLIEKESGLKGYLLRPLSAKLLVSTIPEKEGWVNREKLLDISGRSRKRQMELAKKWGIKEYPSPAGGCLLTDLAFGQRFKEMLEHWPDAKGGDVQLLKLGRHFWSGDNLIIVGRNKEENKKIRELTKKGDIIIEPEKFPGPTILIKGKERISEEALKEAKELMIKYSPKMKKVG